MLSLHSIMYTGWAGLGVAWLLVSVEVVDPGVAPGALLLARGELPHVALVLQLTPVLLAAAAARPVREVAVEDGRGVHLQHGQLRQRGQLWTTVDNSDRGMCWDNEQSSEDEWYLIVLVECRPGSNSLYELATFELKLNCIIQLQLLSCNL